MTENWQHLGGFDPAALVGARMHLHYAAQIVSGVGRTWVPKRDDDSHTNLQWLASIQGLAGEIAPGEVPLGAALDLAGLRLLLLDPEHRVLAMCGLDGRTVDQGYEWLAGEFARRRGPDVGDFAPLHYELPDHKLARGGLFDQAPSEAFEELALWFGNAAAALEEVRVAHGSSPARCWPHHFDLATLISVDGERSIGVGMSPGDSSYPEPYWYVGPWPHPKPDQWPALAGGRWHTDGFVAAVLTGSELVAQANQPQYLSAFLDSAIRASRKLLQAD